jgi:hypothetical protein
MASSGLVEEVRCAKCFARLAPKTLRSESDPTAALQQYQYAECQSCGHCFCLVGGCSKHSRIRTDHSCVETVTGKNSQFFLGVDAAAVEEMGAAVDDSEPHPVCAKPCPTCASTYSLLERLGSSVKSCARCGFAFDGSDSTGCSRHCGVHELPCDTDGNLVFGVSLCDIGGMFHISGVTGAFILPGRWACCGVPCFHSTPECPYYDAAEPQRRGLWSSQPLYKGCADALHTTETRAAALQAPVPGPPPASLYTCDAPSCLARGCRCSPEALLAKRTRWLAQIPWNAGLAVGYPSGAALFPAIPYDQVVYLG